MKPLQCNGLLTVGMADIFDLRITAKLNELHDRVCSNAANQNSVLLAK